MKFCHVTLSVKDIEASLRFYQEIIGLDVKRRFAAGPDTEIAFLGNGDTEVELITDAARDGTEPGNDVSLGFMTGSLEDTIALLREKGYETDGAIISPNPHVSFFFARDPDGYNVQFVKGSSYVELNTAGEIGHSGRPD